MRILTTRAAAKAGSGLAQTAFSEIRHQQNGIRDEARREGTCSTCALMGRVEIPRGCEGKSMGPALSIRLYFPSLQNHLTHWSREFAQHEGKYGHGRESGGRDSGSRGVMWPGQSTGHGSHCLGWRLSNVLDSPENSASPIIRILFSFSLATANTSYRLYFPPQEDHTQLCWGTGWGVPQCTCWVCRSLGCIGNRRDKTSGLKQANASIAT